MAILNWINFSLFYLGLVGIIVWVTMKKTDASADYLLAGRDATCLAIGSSIFGYDIGSERVTPRADPAAIKGLNAGFILCIFLTRH